MKTEDIKKMAQAWLQVQEAGNCAPKMKKEELKGNQHKIDHNKDGKISAADFKGLRKKAKKDQEVEVQTSEATVNELSKATMGSYIGKASTDMQKKRDQVSKGTLSMTDLKKGQKRNTMITKAQDKAHAMESVEELDELKKSTLSSYIKKASGNMAGKTAVQVAKVSSSNSKPDPDLKRGLINRMKGIGRAADKLAKESVEEAATHKPGVASPAGEGLSPSAKKELARKTPMPDFVNEPKIDKKSFDAMRNSGKKAKARSNDNAQGDKNVINKPLDITAKASKKEDDGFKDA